MGLENQFQGPGPVAGNESLEPKVYLNVLADRPREFTQTLSPARSSNARNFLLITCLWPDSRESIQGSRTEPLFSQIAFRGTKIANRRFEAIRANRLNAMKTEVFLRIDSLESGRFELLLFSQLVAMPDNRQRLAMQRRSTFVPLAHSKPHHRQLSLTLFRANLDFSSSLCRSSLRCKNFLDNSERLWSDRCLLYRSSRNYYRQSCYS